MQREAEVRAGKAVGSGLSTTFTPMSDWIIDRPPTEADADCDGDVAVKKRPGSDAYAYFHWSFVKPGMVWRRMSHWSAAEQTPETAVPATQPRRFFSIRRTILRDGDHILDAVDDKGIAWWMRLDTRPHHPAFPPEDPAWQQLSPLPAREVPTESEF